MSLDAAAGLQAALGDLYRIEREIGRGGMATVYLAEDTKHGRMVALKVLHAELAAVVGPHRFRREIAIAAQLQDPHILPLLDSGTAAGGVLWFTMPYVEGESLRDRIACEHQLPLADAVHITQQIAGALDYAHRRGVVHRDVKPENILLTHDGQALLADFGLARDIVNLSTPSGERRLTESGISIGTLEYMSPEQMTGQRDVDARTDIYALGCVMYEMLAGEPPFTGATPQALVARRLVERPLPLRAVRDRIPAAVEEAVEIAIARAPADRFPTASAFADALTARDSYPGVGGPHQPRPSELSSELTSAPMTAPAQNGGKRGRTASDGFWDHPTRRARGPAGGTAPAAPRRQRWVPVAVSLAAIVVVGLGAYEWRERSAAATQPVMLAVLPFESVGDSAVGYFTDGLTDEVRGELAQLSGLQVIARGSSLVYAHSQKPPEQVARELGVRYLLTGQVRWVRQPDGTTLARVEPELILAAPGRSPTVYWREEFDADPSNVLEVQADVASKVASVLNIVLGPDERQTLTQRPTSDVKAYDAFLQAEAATQGLTTTDPPALWRGIGLYTTAVTLDSSFAVAWGRLSAAYSLLYANSTPNPANADAARRALAHAQALAPNRLETQMALSDYTSLVEHDDVHAYHVLSALLQRYPDNAQIIGGVSIDERRLGRWDDALAHAQRAAKLDPLSPVVNRQLSSTLLRMRRLSDAMVSCRHGLSLAPTNLGMISRMVLVYLAQGDLPGAQTVLRNAASVVDTTRLIVFFATTGDLYWMLNDAQQRRLLALASDAYDDDRASWGIRRAEVYWLRGDTGQARLYADTAVRAYQEQLNASPRDYERRMLYALALAYAGRTDDAIREGEQGAGLMPITRNAELGPYMQQLLARVYMMVGQPDRALDHLAPLLTVPYFFTPAWLRIDPTWAPLRGNPRFQRLVSDG